jgi:GPH family glycoside/pentoside/hexuronide:cation symporter
MKINNSILNKKVFDSSIKSGNIKLREMVLGYLLGPLGALMLNASLTAYLNLFYTDVLGLAGEEYGMLLTVFPIASTILVVITNLFMGTIIDKTKTKQGKARPYILISAPLLALSGVLIFAVPQNNITMEVIWIVISYNLYFALSYAIYMMSHSMMVPLSTRDIQQRGKLSVVSNMANMCAAGLFAAIIFPMVILPFVKVDQSKWILVMSIISGLALFLTILEYYNTRERITEESFNLDNKKEKVPFRIQLKAITTDAYWWIIVIYYFTFQAGATFKNNALVYFCNYVLGTYNDGFTQTVLALISGIPMGVGVLFVWPLASKFGKKNLAIAGFILSVVGGIICWINPTNFWVVVIGQTIKAIGTIPGVYIMMALFADVLDHLECKNGFRCDGLSMSLYGAIMVAMTGICVGIFNLMISTTGYVAPMEVAGQTTAALQNDAVISMINWSFIGIEIVIHGFLVILLLFLNVENHIDAEQKIILERHKSEVANEIQ